jgi:cytochrome c-type biogenesis protein CcmH
MKEWWLISVLIGLTCLASSVILYPLRRHLISSLILVPIIFVMAFIGYYSWGSFGKWQGYLQYQEKQERAQAMLKSIKTPKELIDKLRARLKNFPKSAKGWYLLGRLYSSQNEQQNAVNAFAKAYALNPRNEQYAVNYAHSLWQLHHRQFSKQVREILNNLLKNNPNQPDALAMLAMDAYARQAYEEAMNYWQRLLQIVPPQSEEARTIRKALVKAEEQLIRNHSRDVSNNPLTKL